MQCVQVAMWWEGEGHCVRTSNLFWSVKVWCRNQINFSCCLSVEVFGFVYEFLHLFHISFLGLSGWMEFCSFQKTFTRYLSTKGYWLIIYSGCQAQVTKTNQLKWLRGHQFLRLVRVRHRWGIDFRSECRQCSEPQLVSRSETSKSASNSFVVFLRNK